MSEKFLISATGFAMSVDKESIVNIMKDAHQQSVFFGEKMPKKPDWKLLRSWVDRRLEKLENYITNLELLNEFLIEMCIKEEQERLSKKQTRLALPPAESK